MVTLRSTECPVKIKYKVVDASLRKQFETDSDYEKKGVLIEYDDFSFMLARAGGANQAFNKVMRRKSKKHERAIQSGRIKSEVADRIMLETFAEQW